MILDSCDAYNFLLPTLLHQRNDLTLVVYTDEDVSIKMFIEIIFIYMFHSGLKYSKSVTKGTRLFGIYLIRVSAFVMV